MRLKVMAAIALLLLCAFGATMCSIADQEFYHPSHEVFGSPQKDGYIYEEVHFKSADGTNLTGWFIPAKGPAYGTVIHFHGNAENMTAHYGFVNWLPANGFNVLVFDYRGYGKSEGTPSREGVYEDAVAATRYLKTRTDIDQTKIIIFGQSLGGALALRVAGNNHFDGIVGVAEESGFASYRGVAADHFGLLADIAVSGSDSPMDAAAKISPVPLLIIHGTDDPIVPYAHAQQIYAAAKEPKELWTIPGAGHTTAVGSNRPTYGPRLLQKFREWVGVPTPPTKS